MTRALLLLCLVSAASAQPTVRLRAGLNAASLPLIQGASARLAPAASLQLDVPLQGGLSLRPEAFYSSEGTTTPVYGYTVTDLSGEVTRFESRTGAVQAEQLGASVLLAYTAPVGPLQVGAYGGPALAAKVRERDVTRFDDWVQADASDRVDRTSLSMVGGLTAARGRVGVDLRYALGASATAARRLRPDDAGEPVRARVATMALTYQLGGRALATGAPAAAPRRASVGLRAGANLVAPQLFRDGAARVAPALSVLADIPVYRRFSVRPEALYSSEGERILPSSEVFVLEDGTERTFVSQGGAVQAEYVGVGAFVAYTAPVAGLSVSVYGGPSATAKVRERDAGVSQERASERSSAYYNRAAVSGVGGLSVSRGAFGIDVRYTQGLTDALNREWIIGGVQRTRVTSAALVYRPAR